MNLSNFKKAKWAIKYLHLAWVFLYLPAFAQQTPTTVEGQVTEKKTHMPLEFANVKFRGVIGGTQTDSAGHFRIKTLQRVKTLAVSYLGYTTAEVAVQYGKANRINVELSPVDVNLKEIVVKPGRKKKRRDIDTTALYIFHHVVDNKEFNKAASIDSYYFKEYTKMTWSVLNPTEKLLKAKVFKPFNFFFAKKDTDEDGRVFIPIFLAEDYRETFYRKKPKHLINIIHYRKFTGVRNPAYIKLIGYHFQVTDAYEDVHIVFEKSFISPFAPNANSVYNYHVIDTAKIDGRTSYKLNFVGRVKEDLCTKGYAWIDSATWGIKSISYKPNEKANLNYIFNLEEEQRFDLVNGSHWLMTHERQIVEANLIKKPDKIAFRVDKITTRKDIRTDVSMPDSLNKVKDDVVDADAYKKKKSYIDSVRLDSLTPNEARVYQNFDSIKHVPAYKALNELLTLLITANIRAGPVDFGRLYRVVSVNNVEGYRVRMGVYTNELLSDRLYLGVYGAYGTKDKRWKYSFNARTLLPSKYNRWHAIEAEFKSDMVVLGDINELLTYDNITTLISPIKLDKIMRTQEFNLYYERDWIKGLSSNITFTDRTFYSVPGVFNFTQSDGNGGQLMLPSFSTTELTATLRYCKTDYYYEYYTYRTALQTKTPSITLTYTLGLKNHLFNGDYTYNKFQLDLLHRWQLPDVGFAKILVRGGYIFGNSPYPVSFVASSNVGILKDETSFQSTAPFEFVYDRFIMFWWEHYLDGFLFNRIPLLNKLHLRESYQVKAVIGDYSAHNASLLTLPAGMGSTFPIPYVEAGVGIENILKVIEVDFLWRCTYRNNPNAPNFTIKISIYPNF